jgi:hypothetical protein
VHLYVTLYSKWFELTSIGTQTLTDLNDYITPSQACIKPVEQLSRKTEDFGLASVRKTRLLMLNINMDVFMGSDGNPYRW